MVNNRGCILECGWGLVVLAGSFVAYFVADGWSYSFGVVFPEIVDYFGDSKGKTALIPTLLYGIPMIISPVVCVCINILGCRVTGLIGGAFTGLSLLIATFATSVTYLCLSIGILCSVGLSMVYVSSIVIVTNYFDRYRGLATAIAVTGSGLGAFAFPPLMYFLMERYTWRGMLLITSGISFLLIPACALYRAPSTDGTLSEVKKRYRNSIEALKVESHIEQYHVCSVRADQRLGTLQIDGQHDTLSNHQMLESEGTTVKLNNREASAVPVVGMQMKETPATDDFKTLDLMTTDAHKISNENVCSSSFSQDPNTCKEKCKLWRELKSLPSQICDRKLWRNGSYMLYCAANFLLFLWVSMPYVYLVDRALQLQVEESNATFLLSIMAIARTLGQLVTGNIGDLPRVNVNLLYAVGVVLAGAATALVPLSVTYTTMCIYSAAFGAFVSVTSVLPMMCLVELVGLDRATNAFGLLQLMQGLGTLLGTPVAGWLYDATGDYRTSFYIAGAWIALSGLILCPLPLRKICKASTPL